MMEDNNVEKVRRSFGDSLATTMAFQRKLHNLFFENKIAIKPFTTRTADTEDESSPLGGRLRCNLTQSLDKTDASL